MKAVDIEFTLTKPSYTATTLAYLEEKHPSHQFEIIMGSDSFQNLPSWHNAPFIMQRYKINVYQRPQFQVTNSGEADINLLEAPLLDISATHIRKLIKEGKSIRYLVTEKVEREIIENRLYAKL